MESKLILLHFSHMISFYSIINSIHTDSFLITSLQSRDARMESLFFA